jgi:hypothetical protein
MSKVRYSKNIWKQCQERGMAIVPKEVDFFAFDHIDLKIATSIMQGCISAKAIAEDSGVNRRVIKHRLLSPLRCAWISRQLEVAVESRLGQVLSAVYNRAIRTGDPQAAKLLLTQFKKINNPVQQHVHTHMNLNGLTDDQIDKLIDQKKRDLNIIETDFEVVDEPKQREEGTTPTTVGGETPEE